MIVCVVGAASLIFIVYWRVLVVPVGAAARVAVHVGRHEIQPDLPYRFNINDPQYFIPLLENFIMPYGACLMVEKIIIRVCVGAASGRTLNIVS